MENNTKTERCRPHVACHRIAFGQGAQGYTSRGWLIGWIEDREYAVRAENVIRINMLLERDKMVKPVGQPGCREKSRFETGASCG